MSMKIGYKALTLGLAMILAASLFGCAEKKDSTPTEQPQQTTQATEPSTSGSVSGSMPSETEISHFHNGLYITLAESISVTTQEKQLSFESDTVQGGVTFQKLDMLPQGTAQTSEGYARQLLELSQQENSEAWMGTSTGVGYYVVIPSAEKTEVRGLYVWGDLCWEVWAESSDPELTQQLVRIVGRCYIMEGKIPQWED